MPPHTPAVHLSPTVQNRVSSQVPFSFESELSGIGEMEAGVVANWFGAPFSVITGGIGCVAAVAWIAA